MSAREPHWIRPCKRVKIPTRCIFFDTETKTIDSDGTQKMLCAVAVYCEYSFKARTPEPVWLTTVRPEELYLFVVNHTNVRSPLRVLSANIWFDLRVSGMLEYFKKAKWRCNFVYTSSKVFFARFTKGKKAIEFVNIQNYFDNSVAAIGKSIGLAKIEIDFESTTQSDLQVYCRRDVEIIYTAFTKFVDYITKGEIGSIGYTLPATGYSVYRKSFMKKWIFVHCNEEVTELERAAYSGGRCECFHIGKYTQGPYYKLDVNAMYPFVMAREAYPYKLRKIGSDIEVDIIPRIARRYAYVAHVTIKTDQPVYAYRTEKQLTFPIGTFQTYLTTGSLDYAFKNNHLQAIHKIAVYDKEFLFTDYVNHFYSERQRYQKQGNTTFAYVCKLMMNSFYGKFAQRLPELISEQESDLNNNYRELIYNVDERCYYVKQSFYGLEQITKLHMIEAPNSIPVISAHITDYARLYLWQLCKLAGVKNLYYVDTDSLIVNQAGYNLLKGNIKKVKMGYLKREGTSSEIEILGLKNYVFDGVHKLKGIPVKHKKLNDNTYEYTFFPSIQTELREGYTKDYRIRTVFKSINPEYDKGTVLNTGQVIPLKLS